MARNNRPRNRNPLPPTRNPSPPNRNPLTQCWSFLGSLTLRYYFILFLLASVFIVWFFLFSPKWSLPFSVPLSVRPLKDSDISAENFHSPEVFKLDYVEMEGKFKVFMYPEEEKNAVFLKQRKLFGKYASEGYFFQNMRKSQILTEDPDKAHLFFIPVSCRYSRGPGNSYENLAITVQSLISKYPYWNRTSGADHFFVTCHDIGVIATEKVAFLMRNSIQVVCSPSYDAEYVPHKDISLPHIAQSFARPAGGNLAKERTVLAFWVGSSNSDIRNKLVSAWKNDPELDIQNNRINPTTKGRIVYQEKFYRSKFCICPGGSHLHGARITEAIHYGCVPVILSDHFDLPFNNILEWRNFSVIIKENQVNQLKQILKDIPDTQYRTLHNNTLKVQKHFQWNSSPVRLDAFHMVMYELWQRRHVIRSNV